MDTTTGNRDQLDEEASGPDIQRRQRSSIPSFLFISFLFFMLNNHNEEDAVARFQYKDIIQAFEHQLSNYSSWLAGNESNFYLVSPIYHARRSINSTPIPKKCNRLTSMPSSQQETNISIL
jgi:hypothetical protein